MFEQKTADLEQGNQFDAEEPSDEVLMQLETEESLMFEEEEDDFESMTVAQLKDVLRSRGLKVGGRKAELIERLRSS